MKSLWHKGFFAYQLINRDGDGIMDSEDNCILHANPDQRDTNADGFGNRCDPDLDNDNRIDFADLVELKCRFFTVNADADLNGDQRVDFADLAIQKAMFFGSPGPSALVPWYEEAKQDLERGRYDHKHTNKATAGIDPDLRERFAASLIAAAQPPSTLSYQAYLTDHTGAPVDGAVEIRFARCAVDVGGIALWTETQAVPVDRGLTNAELGTFVPLKLADFNAPLFLGITVDRDPEMQPRRPLLAVPYALRAVVLSCLPGDAMACFTGPVESANVGECKRGLRVCTTEGSYAEQCEGEVLPQAEICDGRDNNCNGEVDEGDVCVEHCFKNIDCHAQEYCEKAIGDRFGEGICTIRPLGCPDYYDPVCGCDGVTYGNDCEAAEAGASVQFRGLCPG